MYSSDLIRITRPIPSRVDEISTGISQSNIRLCGVSVVFCLSEYPMRNTKYVLHIGIAEHRRSRNFV